MTLRRPGASPSRPLHHQEPPARTELFVFGIAGRYFVTRPAPRAQSLRRLQVITKGKGRVGRRRGAPPAEHRPRGHHPDRRSRRFGCSGAARSPEPPHPPYAPTRRSEAPAPAHCEPARRAQMCLRHGQAGFRGSADPLKAYGAEYHVGIFVEQVGRFAAHACP